MGAAMFSVDSGYFSLIKKHPLTLTAMSESDFVGADDLLFDKVLVMLKLLLMLNKAEVHFLVCL